MSFSFMARGTRDEVATSLDALTDAQMGNDTLAHALRDVLLEQIAVGTEMADPSDQRYLVKVSGHSGRGSVVTLNARIDIVPFPYQDTTTNTAATDTATATDTLATGATPPA